MKSKLFFVAILIIQTSSFSQYPSQIRIMTYNINAEKHGDGSYSDIVEVIEAINPDICGLQKLDSCNSRNPNDVLKQLGDQTGYFTSFAPAINNYNGSNGSYGIGFLTKEKPVSTRRLLIEHTETEQDRAVLEICLTMGGKNVRVIVTHLAHEGEQYRISQINQIIPWINSPNTTDPVIIMGDFNASPDDNSMKLFENAHFEYVKGKNGEILDTSYHQKINHILYRPAELWDVLDADNPQYSASNRNPVWADMNLKTGTAVKTNLSINGQFKNLNISIVNDLLQYYLEYDSQIFIIIHDACGRQVKTVLNRYQYAGIHTLFINDFALPNGLYNIVLTTEHEKTATQLIHFN